MNINSRDDCALPLLNTQIGLWISEQVNQARTSHNVPIRLSIRGALDRVALQQSVDWLIQRHDNLRARFVLEGEAPRQIIAGRLDTPIQFLHIDPAQRDSEALEARIDALLRLPMDIARGPLFRACLLDLGNEQYVLLLSIHHLVFDGSSIDVLLRDLLAGYEAMTRGEGIAPAPLAFTYARHVRLREASRTPEALDYWLKTLTARPAPRRFPGARLVNGQRAHKAQVVVTALDQATTQSLRTLTGLGTFTPFMVHMAICAMLLHQHTGIRDMVFGMPLSTRDSVEMKDLTGLFVTVVPLRLQPAPDSSFMQVLQHVRARILRAMMHSDLPFHELVAQLRLGQEGDNGALFHIFLNHASVERRPVQIGHTAFELQPATNITAAFEMNLAIVENGQGFDTVFEFDDMLFARSAVEELSAHYHRFLGEALRNPQIKLNQLSPPTARQPDQNPRGQAVHQCFEAQVERAPQAIAVVFEQTRLSYLALNGQANQLASHLRHAGITHNTLVGICIERSVQMVIAILAVLKAGAAYLPIDPDNPDERIQFIVQDTQVGTLLTSSHLRHRFAGQLVNLICVDDPQAFAAHAAHNLQIPVALNDLAYCIYTSGSTGQPKGALNTHSGFANLVRWYVRDGLQMRPDDRVMLASSVGFDLTQKNILGPLCAGACLMIPVHSAAQAGGFLKALSAYRPTWLNCAPSAFRAFAGSPRTSSLRILVLGGEPVDAALVEQLRGRPLTLVNSYGPTECSDVATWCTQDMQTLASAKEMSLGHPIPGVQVYVLDENLQPAPVGVAGEIHIAGTGVGQGYLRRAALTADKFIPDPYGPPGRRLYKTGDLGKRLADGSLVFIGRMDFQVKVRGHRIELGEIESRLLSFDSIREAVVIAMQVSPGENRLVAYLVAAGPDAPDSEKVSTCLRQSLPNYMVPDTWITLARLPLNINGKLDRKALPSPDWLPPPEPAGGYLELTPIKRQPRVLYTAEPSGHYP
jgi:amino acid adenylation domain-containing protein